MLAEFLETNKILLNFKAGSFDQILRKMLRVSEESNKVQLADMIMQRESRMSTALGKGIMMPRAIIEGKTKTEVIIAVSKKDINLKCFDMLPVRVIILYLFSDNDDYPPILAQSLRIFDDDTLRSEILGSKTGDEIITIIRNWEEE